MESRQKLLNQHQAELGDALSKPDQFDKAIQLFLAHHAMLHSAKVSQASTWSFEDELLDDLSEARFRAIPANGEHSIAWCIWHLARIEDVAMNMVVAGDPQVLVTGNWLEKMKVASRDTGNELSLEEVTNLSNTIDLAALRAYRVAVGRKTREIVKQLHAGEVKLKVDPLRIQKVLDEGAVIEKARGIAEYWSRRTITGLLLMPATRHNIVHLNEVMRLKHKRQ